jgi:hypothetical protein
MSQAAGVGRLARGGKSEELEGRGVVTVVGRGGKSCSEKWGDGGEEGTVLVGDMEAGDAVDEGGEDQVAGNVQPFCSRMIASGRGSGGCVEEGGERGTHRVRNCRQ